jgi:hypothetical protein
MKGALVATTETTAAPPSTHNRRSASVTKIQVLEDLVQAVEDYPHSYLTIEVIDVVPKKGTSINVNEAVAFGIQVTNSGPLDVTDLVLTVSPGSNIAGQPIGTVQNQGKTDSFTSDGFDTDPSLFRSLPGHKPNDPVVSGGDPFHLKIDRVVTSSNQALVAVSVKDWKTSFDHITGLSHTKADSLASGYYRGTVEPE